MTYALNGLIQADDYNTLVGSTTSTTPNTLNATWATGTSSAGYGQTAETNVTAGNSVTAAKWANLVNKTGNAASHQGSTLTTVTAPVTGGTISHLAAIPTNLTTVYTNRLNAVAQSTPILPITLTQTSNWSNILRFNFTITFNAVGAIAAGDAARHFFNSGGQLKITASHPSVSDPVNQLVNTLASDMGTVVVSSPGSGGTATIVGTPFTGVTIVNGTLPYTVQSNLGYYGLTVTPTEIFRKNTTSTPYNGSYILVRASTNGTQGSNQDNGSIINITVEINVDPNDFVLTQPTSATLQVFSPSTTYLSVNSWGTPAITTSITQL